MPFMVLNGTTVRVSSTNAVQKYNESGVDRARMFDGSYRMTRRGVWREWDPFTALYTEDDANTLIAILLSPNLPLTLTGDIVGSDSVLVMPTLLGNDPVQTASGFLRRVTFKLDETPGLALVDRSAVPFIFLRAGTNLYSDNAGTVAATDGDPVGQWKDARPGSTGYFQRYFSDSFKPHRDGDVVHFDETGSGTVGSLLIMDSASITTWNGFSAAEIMAALRSDIYPPGADGQGTLWWFGDEGMASSAYAKTDGHVYGSFGVGATAGGAAYDLGVAPSNLADNYHVFGEASDGTAYTARFDNMIIRTVTVTSDSHSHLFNTLAPAIGHGNPGANAHWLGRIKHLVIFGAILTDAQRRSWYDFLRGAALDPPIA
jgi:hypothetical protein